MELREQQGKVEKVKEVCWCWKNKGTKVGKEGII